MFDCFTEVRSFTFYCLRRRAARRDPNIAAANNTTTYRKVESDCL